MTNVDPLLSMQVFVRVAQHASFAAAARDLQLSAAAVSKHVNALESRIGARLLDRTTRRVGLTEAGGIYLERCLECLHTFEEAQACVGELAKGLEGILRVAAPIDFGDNLAPVLAGLMTAHPKLTVDLRLSNHVVDMVEEGVDVGVRIAPSLDGAYVARPLARTHLAVFGAPAYFRQFGRPLEPGDLASHRCFAFTEPRPRHELVFLRDGREIRVKLNVVMLSNNGAALMAAMRQGVGLCVCPSFMAHGDINAGRIEPVLLDWSLPEYRVFAVYPHRRYVSAKVRTFVEALTTAFGDGSQDPWWPSQFPVLPAPAHLNPGGRARNSRAAGSGGKFMR